MARRNHASEKRAATTEATSPLNNVITIDDERIKNRLDRVVRDSVEKTLNALLDAETHRLCNAQRYERSEARRDTRAGHYKAAIAGRLFLNERNPFRSIELLNSRN